MNTDLMFSSKHGHWTTPQAFFARYGTAWIAYRRMPKEPTQ